MATVNWTGAANSTDWFGQNTHTNPVTTNWSSTPNFPGNGDDVVIGGGITVTDAFANQSNAISAFHSLTLGVAGNAASVTGGNLVLGGVNPGLVVNGTSVLTANDGGITLGSANVSFSGGGILETSSINYKFGGAATSTVTNNGDTIEGGVEVDPPSDLLTLVNEGIFDSNNNAGNGVDSTIAFHGNGGVAGNSGGGTIIIDNDVLIEATGAGSTVGFFGVTVDNSGGGQLQATGTDSIMEFESATVLGGALLTRNSVLSVGETTTFDGSTSTVTIDGVLDLNNIDNGTSILPKVTLKGTVEIGSHSASTIQINPNNTPGAILIIQGNGVTIFAGSGITGAVGAGLLIQGTVSSDTLHNNGTIDAAGGLTIQGLTIANAGVIDADGTANSNSGFLHIGGGVTATTIVNTGLLENTASGTLFIDSNATVQNSNEILAAGSGGIDVSGAITGNGELVIGQGSKLELSTGGSVSGFVQFIGAGAMLQVDSAANQLGGITGAVAGDIIDARFVQPAAGVHAVWHQNGALGTLSLVNGNSTLASFILAGQYVTANFSATSDNNGGTEIVVQTAPNPPPPAGTTADLILRDGGNGDYEIYNLGGNAILAAGPLGQVGTDWQVAGVGAFDAPDTSDMILRNSNSGAFEIYDISNNNIANAAAMGQVGLEWSVAGFGDFSSRANETDMLMRNSNTGAFEIYDLANNAITSAASMGQVGLEWSVAGFGDFSGRANETDMLMRNSNTGAFEIYDIANNTLGSFASMGQVGLEWSVAGFGDFSGHANETDMLMRNSNTGAFEIYDITNNTLGSFASMGAVGPEWQVVGFGSINGAGTSDMLMRNTNTGAFEVYDITNNTLGSFAPMGRVGLDWSVAGIAADPPGGSAPANAQLTQAMASFDPAGNALDTSASISAAAPPPNLLALLTAQRS
jgi:hypothetical protein